MKFARNPNSFHALAEAGKLDKGAPDQSDTTVSIYYFPVHIFSIPSLAEDFQPHSLSEAPHSLSRCPVPVYCLVSPSAFSSSSSLVFTCYGMLAQPLIVSLPLCLAFKLQNWFVPVHLTVLLKFLTIYDWNTREFKVRPRFN